MDVHTLTIKLAGDVGDLLQKMNLAKRGVDGAMSGMEGAIGGVKTAMAGLAAGLTVGAFASMIRDSIDLADGLNDLSKSTGLSVEKLSGLKLAAKQSGGDLESIAASVNKLSVNIAKDAEKFAKLGVTAKDPLEAFKQLADVFSAIEDPQLRAALGAEALGKSWQGAVPLLAEGGQRIGEMVAKGAAMSGITQEMADKADLFNDQMAEMEAKVSGAKMKLAGEMLPAMVEITAAITNAYEESGKLSAIWVAIGALGAFTFTNEFASTTTKIKDLQEELAALEQEKYMAENRPMVGIVSRWLFGSSDVNGDIAKAKAAIADLQAQMDKPSKDAAQRRADAEAAKKSAAEAAEAARKATAFLDLKKKADEAAATELKKQADLLATLSGVNADYMEQLSRLQAIRAKGNISEERYIELVTELINKQPMVVKLAKEQEDLEKERLKMAEAARAARFKEIEAAEKAAESLEDGNKALRDEIELIGLSEAAQVAILQQRNEVIILTKEATLAEMQRQSAITQTQTRVEIALAAEIEALKERNKLLTLKQEKTIADTVAKDAASEAKRTADQIEHSITDGLMRGFENGKPFVENFRDVFENTFKTLVLRPGIQAGVEGVFGLSGGAAGGGAGSNPYSGIGQLAASFEKASLALTDFKLFSTNAAYDLGGSLTKAGFDKAGSLVTENASQIGSLANTVGRTLSYLDAASNFKDGSYGKSIGQAAGTFFGGPIGGQIGKELGNVLDRIFGGGDYVQSLGESVATITAAKVVSLGGSGGNNDTSIGGGLNIRQTDTSDKFVGNLASAFVKAATQLGISTSGASFGAGFNNSDGGKFAVEATVGGAKYDPGQVKYTDANLALEASRAVFFALQSSELPGYLSKVFNGITASTAAQADIDAALQYAGSLKQIRDALTETRTPLQILQDSVAAAFTSLGTSADTFKTDFVAAIDGGISPDKLAQFQLLGANLDALTQNAKESADKLAETNKSWQNQLDLLTGKETERSIALRDATDASTRAIMEQVYAQQDLKSSVAEMSRVAGIVSSQQAQLLNAAGLPVNAAGSRDGQSLFAGSSDRVQIPKTIAELNSSLDAFGGRAYQNADASGVSEYARSLGLTAQNLQDVLDKLAADDRAAQAAFSSDGTKGDDNARYAAMATGGGAADTSALDAANALANERKALQDQLDDLQFSAAQKAAKAREAISEENRALFDQLEQARATKTAAEEASKALEKFNSAMRGLTDTNADLQIKLLEAQGNTAGAQAAARSRDIARLTDGFSGDEAAKLIAQYDANEALRAQIEGLTKAQQDAASAADKLKSTWSGITDGLLKEVDRIRGVMAATSADSYAALESRFAIATAQARAGDLTAAGNLTSYSGQLSGAFSEKAGSRTELIRMQAQLAQSLQDTAVILGAPVAPVNTPPVINTDKLEASIATLNAEITSLKSELSAIKSNTGRTVDAVNSLRDSPLVVEIEE